MEQAKFEPRAPDLKGKVQTKTETGYENIGEVSLWYLPQGKYSFRGNINLDSEKFIVWIEAPTQIVEKPALRRQRARTRNAHASIAKPEGDFISQKIPISPEEHTPKRQSN